MKTTNSSLLLFGIVAAFLITSFNSNQAFAQKKPKEITIGVYDSRVVVFAYSRSELFSKRIAKFSHDSDSATKANDTVKLKEYSIQAMSYQHLLHLMVFSMGIC